MTEKTTKPTDAVTLNLETIVQTTEARHFIDEIRSVGKILSLKDSEVTFKGEEIAKIGIVGDCKSVQLFKCPNGYFVFCNKAFSMTNWSAADSSLENLLNNIYDPQITEKIAEALKSAKAA